MSGRIIAIYSAKGGVGKTTLAVNLSWASAALSKRRTLLWDLDPQGGASYLLRQDAVGPGLRAKIIAKDDIRSLVRNTDQPHVDMLSADRSLRHLDRDFHELKKRKRLAKIAQDIEPITIGSSSIVHQGLRKLRIRFLEAADIVVVPVIPAALSQRALEVMTHHLMRKKGPQVVVAPVFSMVDRRRALHRAALEEHSAWPVIPLASAYERMSENRCPIGALLPLSAVPVEAVAQLWRRLEKTLATA